MSTQQNLHSGKWNSVSGANCDNAAQQERNMSHGRIHLSHLTLWTCLWNSHMVVTPLSSQNFTLFEPANSAFIEVDNSRAVWQLSRITLSLNAEPVVSSFHAEMTSKLINYRHHSFSFFSASASHGFCYFSFWALTLQNNHWSLKFISLKPNQYCGSGCRDFSHKKTNLQPYQWLWEAKWCSELFSSDS